MAAKDELHELKKAVGLDDKAPTLKQIRAAAERDEREAAKELRDAAKKG